MNKLFLVLGFVIAFTLSSFGEIKARTATPISPIVNTLQFDDIVVDFADQGSVEELYETILKSYAHQLSLFQLDQDLVAQIMNAAQYEVAFVYNVHRNTSNSFPVVISFNDVTPIYPPIRSLSAGRSSECTNVGTIKLCSSTDTSQTAINSSTSQTLSTSLNDDWGVSDLSLGAGWGTTGAGGGYQFGTGYEATGTFTTPLGDYDFSAGMYGSAFSVYCLEEECEPYYWSDTFYDLSLDGPGPITFSYGGFMDEGFDNGEFSVGVDLLELGSAIGAAGDYLFGN